jgi:hypothetical protein
MEEMITNAPGLLRVLLDRGEEEFLNITKKEKKSRIMQKMGNLPDSHLVSTKN